MFEGKSILDILQIGGFTLYVLFFCSLLSITVILEKLLHYRKISKPKRAEFMARIGRALKNNNFEKALAFCETSRPPFSRVVYSGLELYGRPEKEISNAMERNIRIETARLERYTGVVGTIGNIAVYIGLFGTVLGIIHAFHDISVAGAGGMSIVIGGVAEALVCTAVGLSVAIPAVVAYNFFNRRVERFVDDMELCASEVLDLMGAAKR
jgi:biopolymer transport protein ExbB